MMRESRRVRSMIKFDDLPMELKVECIARVDVEDQPNCALVSRNWRGIMSSIDLLVERVKKLRMGRKLYLLLATQGKPKWYVLKNNHSRFEMESGKCFESVSLPTSMASIGSDIFVLKPKQEISSFYTMDSTSLNERESIALKIPRNTKTLLAAIKNVLFITSIDSCESYVPSLDRETKKLPRPPLEDDDEIYMADSWNGDFCLWVWSRTNLSASKVQFDNNLGEWQAKVPSSLSPSYHGFSQTVILGEIPIMFRTIFKNIYWLDEMRRSWVRVNGFKKFITAPLHVAAIGKNIIAIGRRETSGQVWVSELEVIVSKKQEGENVVFLRELWTELSIMIVEEKSLDITSVSVGN